MAEWWLYDGKCKATQTFSSHEKMQTFYLFLIVECNDAADIEGGM